jgi:hypothetical protein
MLICIEITINNYLIDTGKLNSSWVISVTVPSSDVVIQVGSGVVWPASKETRDEITNALLYILRRNWIASFALYPEY